MINASLKKKENIAEYLLYMWQIEDIIRAYALDLDKIKAGIIDKYTTLSDEQRRQMYEWYESLIDMMRREGVAVKGHLQLNRNVIIQLDDLHRRLMKEPKYSAYANQFYATLPFIVELRAKSGDEKPGEIESCFNALYGVLMLRLAGKDVSPETLDAIKQISKFLAVLAAFYKKDAAGELEFTDD